MPKTASQPRRGRPPSGAAMSAAERMRRMRARRKAAGLHEVTVWAPRRSNAPVPYSSHRVAEVRSLAFHTVIAERISRDPSLLQIAHRNVARWRTRQGDAPAAWLREWEILLQQPWPQVAALITEMSENATRLRQSSPFAGVLRADERRRIHEAFRT